ncbi:MAG: hypothetical protein GTO02_13710 [Candidatus Dadabacteria bacterium]|nr:hypothetical protein [Candidatus Dadabacteria bacterium]
MNPTNKTEYRHFIFPKNNGVFSGGFTIAYAVKQSEESDLSYGTGTYMVNYGVSFCSPKEKGFTKAVGRKIAEERVNENLFFVPRHAPISSLFKLILLDIIVNHNIPNKLKFEYSDLIYNYIEFEELLSTL